MNVRHTALMAALMTLSLGACGRENGGAELAPAPEMNVDEAVPDASAEVDVMLAPVSESALHERIAILSSDEFGGRAPATPGGEKTREWLAAQMAELGLMPANGDSYEQLTPLVEVTLDKSASRFTLGGKTFEYGPEIVFWSKRVEEDIAYQDSELVFVGYGIVAPEYGWDDYADIDVTGKTVVMLVNDPGFATGDENLFNGNAMTYYGRWTYKFEEAARQGAAGAIIVHQTAPAAYGWNVVEGGWTGPQLDLERPDGGAGRVAVEGWIQADNARALFVKAGMDFDALAASAHAKGFRATPLGGLKADAVLKNNIRRSTSANVAGIIPGTENPDEFVLYMAHWDHLGVNHSIPDGDNISNGAVDNATGTAGILTIAESFLHTDQRPKRSLLFLAVTAEESGLLGSAYFAEDPFVPLGNIVGGINVDALLPSPPAKDLIVTGYGASELEDLLQKAADKRGMYLRPDPAPEKGYFYRSDHISLAKKGVPMLYLETGIDLIEGGEAAGRALADDYVTNRYHQPSDEYSLEWDLAGMTSTLTILQEVGADMAYSDIWPNWREGNEFRALRDAQRAPAQ